MSDLTIRQRKALHRRAQRNVAPSMPQGMAVVEEILSVLGIIVLPFVLAAMAATFGAWLR